MRRACARAIRLGGVLAAACAVTAACGISGASTTNNLLSGPTGTPITVGISLPLSGPQQAGGFQLDGQACEKGYELWASDVNSHGGLLGRPVKLVILNDQGSENLTRANYRTLITRDHVDLTLAPFSSLLTVDAAKVTDKYHYVLAAGSAGAPTVYKLKSRYLFSTNVPVVNQMVPFADWVLSLPASERPTTAAYPMVNDPFADPPVQKARKLLQGGGIKTVYAAPAGGYNPTANLTPFARKVVASGAQIVVLGSVDVPTVEAFVKDFISQGYEPKMIIAAAGPDQGQAFLNKVGTSNADGIMVPNGWYGGLPNALSHTLVQDYIAKYGGTASDINADVAESYSAGEVLATAVTATGSLSQAALVKWLHGGHTLQTVLGPVAFDNIGENTHALTSALIFQWQPGGHFVQVLPAGPGSVPILRTKPQWAGG
jgi:branched-chain amino acid transport system substrate-binding protein